MFTAIFRSTVVEAAAAVVVVVVKPKYPKLY